MQSEKGATVFSQDSVSELRTRLGDLGKFVSPFVGPARFDHRARVQQHLEESG